MEGRSSKGMDSAQMRLCRWLSKRLTTGFMVRFTFWQDFFCPKTRIKSSCAGSGRVESTYEPAMTKSFLHGRTEAIRTVQPESVAFVKVSHNNVHFGHLNVAHNAQHSDVLLRDCNTSREDCCSAQSM